MNLQKAHGWWGTVLIRPSKQCPLAEGGDWPKKKKKKRMGFRAVQFNGATANCDGSDSQGIGGMLSE